MRVQEVLTEEKKIYIIYLKCYCRAGTILRCFFNLLCCHIISVLEFSQYNGLGRWTKLWLKNTSLQNRKKKKKQSWIITIVGWIGWLVGFVGWRAWILQIISNLYLEMVMCLVFDFCGAITRYACRIFNEQMLLIIIWLKHNHLNTV